MKKYLYILLIFIEVLLFIGCEQIDVIESDIPYKEVFIVNGRLIGDSSQVKVSFTKSFPIEQEVSREQVALTDITAYIWNKNQGLFPLVHIKDGIYEPKNILKIRTGSIYELYAKVEEERIFAETLAPNIPEVEEVKILGDFINCKIIPNPFTVYAAKYNIISLNGFGGNFNESVFFEVSNKIIDTTNAIEIRTSSLPLEYFEKPEGYNVTLTVYALDENYKDYFDTRENNKPIENIFSEGGGSVYWNIKGEKSIGMFIAYTKLNIYNIE